MRRALSLKEIFGEDYTSFLSNCFFSAVKKAAKTKKIRLDVLQKINQHLGSSGRDLFDYIPAEQLELNATTSHNGGDFYRVKFPLTEDYAIDLFIKQYASIENFKRSESRQNALRLINNPCIVQSIYTNPANKVIVFPFVQAKSFADVMERATSSEDLPEHSIYPHKPEESGLLCRLYESPISDRRIFGAPCHRWNKRKLAYINEIITEYRSVFKHLTDNKKMLQSKLNLERLLDCETRFDRYFFDRLSAKDTEEKQQLTATLKKYFGKLFDECNDVIHTDLHAKNILVKLEDEKVVKFIDFDTLMLGFREYDYAKLLTKLNLEEHEETYALICMRRPISDKEHRWFFEERASLSPEENESIAINEFYMSSDKKYWLAKIEQELATVARYFNRSQSEKDDTQLKNYALTSYNIALRLIRRCEALGFIGKDLRFALKNFMKHYPDTFYSLKRSEYDEHLFLHNPHRNGSMSNLKHTPSLEAVLTSKESPIEVKTELKKLKKNLVKRNRRKLKKTATVVGATLLFAAATAGHIFGWVNYNHQQEIDEKQSELSDALIENRYNLLVAGNPDINYNRRAQIAYHECQIYEKEFMKKGISDAKRFAVAYMLDKELTLEAVLKGRATNFAELLKYASSSSTSKEQKEARFKIISKVEYITDSWKYDDGWGMNFSSEDISKQFRKDLELSKQKFDNEPYGPEGFRWPRWYIDGLSRLATGKK